MRLQGWGGFPTTDASVLEPVDRASVAESIRQAGKGTATIARGSARSYGDSSLAPRVVSSRYLDNFIEFDASRGEIRCGAGVTLDQLLHVTVPSGWFLPVVPGTRHVTLGGAIASDIHGKNHHLDGCFSRHVKSVSLMLASGEVAGCSDSRQKALFRATCGGMGLTGVILDATLRLEKIESAFIDQQVLMANNLEEVFSLFDSHHENKYSVAWLDNLARDERLGRSVLFLGHWSRDGALALKDRYTVGVPPVSSAPLQNRFSIGAFNAAYFHRHRVGRKTMHLHYNEFFFPLDRIRNWNRLYGRKGFIQYQFVVPTDSSRAAIESVLKAAGDDGRGSLVSVLKKMGPANDNFLSFPLEGYTLAMDFKMHATLPPLLDRLDSIVLEHGGRLYLSKDSRMSRATFEQGYPRLPAFLAARDEFDPDGVFGSVQSARLGITPS